MKNWKRKRLYSGASSTHHSQDLQKRKKNNAQHSSVNITRSQTAQMRVYLEKIIGHNLPKLTPKEGGFNQNDKKEKTEKHIKDQNTG